ncbi:hypothetical protein E2C01_099762 [Portunus trituberculatus]|uniref:Secreted protein n=1 Tax=Portunus trituberculatus TaxID=210409 RepID=A0A5B7K159_PORTR|nr:hypothetical protein [Portunus trituberculatus]
MATPARAPRAVLLSRQPTSLSLLLVVWRATQSQDRRCVGQRVCCPKECGRLGLHFLFACVHSGVAARRDAAKSRPVCRCGGCIHQWGLVGGWVPPPSVE